MIEITPHLWIGSSGDAEHANLSEVGITALLNVAHDLEGKRGHSDGLLYAQCGLMDGPGNVIAVYHAAVLMLSVLRNKTSRDEGRKVLVYDHNGSSNAVAAVIMYLHVTRRMGWEYWLKIIAEKFAIPVEDARVNSAHRDAFNRINWRLLSSVIEA